MNTFPIGIMKVKIHILYQACEYSVLCALPVKSTCLSPLFFFLSHIFTVKCDNHSESFKYIWQSKTRGRKPGKRKTITFYPISSKLTSARGRPNGQKATLFWASYLLKKAVTISVAAAKRSARASCTRTCTWKHKQAHFYNRLCPWNITTPTFSENIIINNAILWQLEANCWGPLVKQMAIKCYPTYSTEAVV